MAESQLPPFAQATAGACGSVVSNTIVYPLDLLSTRVQTQSRGRDGKAGYQSIAGALHEIFRKRGIAGLYQGWAADSLSNTLSNFLFFFFRSFFVERLRRQRMKRSPPKPDKTGKVPAFALTAVEDLLIGMIAGATSRFFTTPLSNVTVRMQTSATAKAKPTSNGKGKEKARDGGELASESEEDDEDEYGTDAGIVSTLQQIVAEKGMGGLWAGYETAVLLSATPALTFYLSHLVARLTLPRATQDSQQPSSLQTFLVNAVGNAGSTAIMFPLILSKTRLQWKSPSGKRVYRSLADVLQKTMKKSGVQGLYQGLESQLLKGLVSHGTTMVVKQRVESLIVMIYLALAHRKRMEGSVA